MEKLKKALTHIVMFPLYWISYIFPKDKKLWLFGAWFGEKYSDNSKYLFEYISKEHPEIKAVWLTKNPETFNLVKKKGLNVCKTYSLKGIWYALRANVCVVSTSLRDINLYTTAKVKVVQLWHGIPLKKIMFDDKISFKHPGLVRKILFIFFPFLKKDIYYSDALLIATSEEVQDKLASAFKVPRFNVKVTGYPRNDVFFHKEVENSKLVKRLKEEKRKGKSIAVYMPTHRKEGKIDIGSLLLNELEFIDRKLEEINCVLLTKFHFYHSNKSENKDLRNIIFVNDEMINQDIYPVLKMTDILITDYSSVYFDYLLLNKPIIFAPFDIEEYLKGDREFYYDYNKVTPGPKCKNWVEVLNWIYKFIENPKLYERERLKIRDIFHKYRDGESSKRVFNEIIKNFS